MELKEKAFKKYIDARQFALENVGVIQEFVDMDCNFTYVVYYREREKVEFNEKGLLVDAVQS